MRKVNMDAMHSALAMALHNLCVRNNIDYKDMIKTIKETRELIKKK